MRKLRKSGLQLLLNAILLFCTISLSVNASQPLLPGDKISESGSYFEFRDFLFLPFTSEIRDFSPSKLVISIDKHKLFPFNSFTDLPVVESYGRYIRNSIFQSSTCLIPILDQNCILRI